MTKTVFITGASSGFGNETVKRFQKEGWNVTATMRSPENNKELSALPNVLVIKLDVADKQSITDAVNKSVERFGTIDVLVNNAGYGTMGALEAASEEIIKRQFEVNVFGLIGVTQAVLPTMRKQKSGYIVNISSMGGRITFPFLSLYHASKFAVEGLTEAMQYELNPLGIKLKLIEPGSFNTDFAGRSMGFYGIGELQDYKLTFNHLLAAFEKSTGGSKNISDVADAIFEAITDNSDKLRYPVGADAIQLLQTRQNMDDAAYKNMTATQMGL